MQKNSLSSFDNIFFLDKNHAESTTTHKNLLKQKSEIYSRHTTLDDNEHCLCHLTDN